MEKVICYKREGKFGKSEFLIGLDNFNVIKSKETAKAYAIGEYQDWRKSFYVDCWVAKSMCVEIEGKIFVPTWILDKYCDMTRRINNDYYNREYEIKNLPETPSKPEKSVMDLDTLKDKYLKRLADACKDGFRCCLIDKADEIEVQKLFFNDEYYYFTEQDDELWLNWE